jgi:hypothetical protein
MRRAQGVVLRAEVPTNRFWDGIIGLGRQSGRLIRGVIGGGGRMGGFRRMLGIGLRLLFRCLRMGVWIRSLGGRRLSRWELRRVAEVFSGGGVLLCLERVW